MLSQFSAVKTKQYLEETKKLTISLRNILIFFIEIRKIIYKYYFIQYNFESFCKENENKYYSINPLWVLGMANNETKDFRVVVSKKRSRCYMEI